jgi:hypothetical protein
VKREIEVDYYPLEAFAGVSVLVSEEVQACFPESTAAEEHYPCRESLAAVDW